MNIKTLLSHNLLRTVLFAIFLVNGLIYIPSQSITGDEGDHFNYAVRFVKGHPEKIKPFDDASTMPLTAGSTVPRIIEQLLSPSLVKSDNGASDLIHGRYFTLFFSAFIGLIVYRWALELYGRRAALVSLFFFVFCPNISAHASLVTTDAFSALFTILPAYYFWKFCREKKLVFFSWFIFWLSVGQLAKQSLTWLYPLFIIAGLSYFIYSKAWVGLNYRKLLVAAGIFILLTAFVVNAGFQFKESGKPLETYAFKSEFFSGLKDKFSLIGSLPLPLPSPYLYGLDYTKNMDEMGGGHAQSSGKIYLLGESRQGAGFYSYYFIVGFFKTPIPLLITILTALFLLMRKRLYGFFEREYFLLLPVLFFLVYFNFFYKSQVGLRHILMIYPFLIVFAGRPFINDLKGWWSRSFAVAMGAWSVASFYYYFPLLIPYTNEFVTDKKFAYKIMADSNLDYDNAFYYLQRFQHLHPEIKYAPLSPATGKFVIRTTDLLDLNDLGRYAWIRNNFEPVDVVAFTYLVYEISEEQLISLDHKQPE